MGGMTVVCEGCGVRLYMKTLSSILTFVSQVHRKYTAADFDDDLRTVLRRSGCRDEKIVFIMDESNVLESGFLERMNTLLANGEVCSLLLFQTVKCLLCARYSDLCSPYCAIRFTGDKPVITQSHHVDCAL